MTPAHDLCFHQAEADDYNQHLFSKDRWTGNDTAFAYT